MSTNPGGEAQKQQNRGRAYPNPPPKPGISERLERVRAHMGYQSKRAFWQRLCEGWDEAVSYEAVRNYHYDREPPPSYLARVVRVFPEVRLEWLVTGAWEMLSSKHQKNRKPFERNPSEFEVRYPFLRHVSSGTAETFLDLVTAYRGQVPGGSGWRTAGLGLKNGEETVRQLDWALADDLAFLLHLPLLAWGFETPTWLPGGAGPQADGPDWNQYFQQMMLALKTALKRPNSGDPLDERPLSYVPRLRRDLDGKDPKPREEEIEQHDRFQRLLDEGEHNVFERRRQLVLENIKMARRWARDLPPGEPVKPLANSDLISCEWCEARIRVDKYQEHTESEHPDEVSW